MLAHRGPVRLEHEFYRLPLRFDADRLMREVDGFDEGDWQAHPQDYRGNSAIALVSDEGGARMTEQAALERCAYLRQVLAALDTGIGRARLMRIAPGEQVPSHTDSGSYWQSRVRVHIPVITDPRVIFECNGVEAHMGAGETWTFSNWRHHSVRNPTDIHRIHLVVDTCGTASFWRMMGDSRFDPTRLDAAQPRLVMPDDARPVRVPTEWLRKSRRADPNDMDARILEVLLEVARSPDNDPDDVEELTRAVDAFRHVWRGTWARHGDSREAAADFFGAYEQLHGRLEPLARHIFLVSNGVDAVMLLSQRIAEASGIPDAKPLRLPVEQSTALLVKRGQAAVRFDRPLIIVAAPRSGSTLLFETLAGCRGLVTIGGESHRVIEGISPLSPRDRGFDSNRLLAVDASEAIACRVRERFAAELLDHAGKSLEIRDGEECTVRFLEKTPKNALRIPFLCRVFPDARFVFLFRAPEQNLSSIMDAWRSGRFVTYPGLPEWSGPKWSLLLTPGWRSLAGQPLERIALEQWCIANQTIFDDLSRLDRRRWMSVAYDELVRDPKRVVRNVCRHGDVAIDERDLESFSEKLPLSRFTLTAPDADKWRRHNGDAVERVLPETQLLFERLQGLTR